MGDTAISIEGLSKLYRLGMSEQRQETLVASALRLASSPWRRLKELRRLTRFSGDDRKDAIWALRDINATVKAGEVVGVIGKNGAGKSTLLKILSRITEPSHGRVEIFGRVGSLLEVGTGFHPDLTGRENVYLNGTILGMRKHEVDSKLDQIVDFSGVEKFLDTPVKRYSSGMRVRLAFSVAAHLEPEILLIDEVLAVGDASFQQKCLGRMNEVAKHGRTVFFVSHNMGAVSSLCTRCLWIHDGVLAGDGPTDDMIEQYLRHATEQAFAFSNEQFGLDITDVALKDSGGTRRLRFRPGDDLVVEVNYRCRSPFVQPSFWIKVQSMRGPCFAANMKLDGHRPQVLSGTGTLRCRFRELPLLPQDYTVVMGIASGNDDVVMSGREVASFAVEGNLLEYGFDGDVLHTPTKSTAVINPYEWTLPDGRRFEVALRPKLRNPEPAAAPVGEKVD